MKILLRERDGVQFGWYTATYNGKNFLVDDCTVYQDNIVSVMNDNRKNHIVCSCCGKVFPKNGRKFEEHKRNAEDITPCLSCRSCHPTILHQKKPKYTMNTDGTFTQKQSNKVQLTCTKGLWDHYDITSAMAKNHCKLRQCGTATAKEITDVFTRYPGVFDDIITVDRIIENGYENVTWNDKNWTEYKLSSELMLSVLVNRIGIVDRFYLNDSEDDCGWQIFYSKKYDTIFSEGGDGYEEYHGNDEQQLKEYFAKLYR